MSYTPVELRHVKVGRSLFGYNRAFVEQLIEEVAQSFEATWRERGELADEVESLEKEIADLRRREHLLMQTLVAAEQAATDVRERALREAETIVQEAHHEARAIGRAAQSQRERLVVESKRIEGILRAALGVMESEPAVAAATPASVVVPLHEPEPVDDDEPEPAEHELEPFAEDESVDPLPVAPAAPEPEPDYGWSREDTREFEPISSLPEPAPFVGLEPEHHPDEPPRHAASPLVERIQAAASHDFDWGE
jgi:cell division initiation protein